MNGEEVFLKDLSFFANTGYKFNETEMLSIYGRTDKHNTTNICKIKKNMEKTPFISL